MHGIVLQTVSWEHYADGDPSVVKGKPREAPAARAAVNKPSIRKSWLASASC